MDKVIFTLSSVQPKQFVSEEECGYCTRGRKLDSEAICEKCWMSMEREWEIGPFG
jgi:hypothetical protein